MIFSSMNVHGVKSIRAMVEPLECYGRVSSTTKLVITGADGNEFTVTCFSDKPVAVETVHSVIREEEAVPA